MNKERNDIVLWTWYNGQFLFQFDEELRLNPSQSMEEFMNKFKTNQGIYEYDFYHTKNQGTIIVLLYGLMVIPREIWEKESTKFPFQSRNLFRIKIPSDKDIDTIDFIRLLRNSLAHANFSLNVENGTWNFWNIRNNGNRNFEIEIKHFELGLFTAEIGKYYINEVRNKTNL